MIKFRRKKLPYWSVCKDYDPENIPLLRFNDRDELLRWIQKTLPWTTQNYPLRIVDDAVLHFTVIGYLED